MAAAFLQGCHSRRREFSVKPTRVLSGALERCRRRVSAIGGEFFEASLQFGGEVHAEKYKGKN